MIANFPTIIQKYSHDWDMWEIITNKIAPRIWTPNCIALAWTFSVLFKIVFLLLNSRQVTSVMMFLDNDYMFWFRALLNAGPREVATKVIIYIYLTDIWKFWQITLS